MNLADGVMQSALIRVNPRLRHVCLLAAAYVLFAVPLAVFAAEAPRVAVNVAPADPGQLFASAAEAYNKGRFDEAVRQYEQILAGGHAAPALFFNLGNAYYRLGQTGRAVLNFRKAWQMKPRDSDIVANIRFALESGNAVAPAASVPAHLLTRLSWGEWASVATAGYWALIAVVCAHLLTRRRHALLLRIALGLAILALAGLAGAMNWWGLSRRPEVVVIRPGQQALFAPLEGSTPHFALPEGSIARLEERSGGWMKVSSGNQAGWIPESAAEVVQISTINTPRSVL
jgi:tetratricopeptide (TPR) repeat protein